MKQDGVSVRRSLRDRIGAERAAGAGAVVHHDGLLERLGHLGREDARHRIDAAAGRERHHEADRLVRIVLRAGVVEAHATSAKQQRELSLRPCQDMDVAYSAASVRTPSHQGQTPAMRS